MSLPTRLLALCGRLARGGLAAMCFASAAAGQTGEVQRPTPATQTAPVATASGSVTGLHKGGLDWFLGVPYAAPPLGELRWRPPAPPRPWSKPYPATAFSPWCMQVAAAGFSKPILNEDCLYLNVVTSHGASLDGRKRAVMVWVHGGGLRQGRSNDYDPTLLVAKGDVVFVSFDYRLNIMGFLAHPALDREGHAFADYGLMDQQAALAWVRRNIAAFGGDPHNVTLFGESSGGANVFTHLTAPGSAPLFDKAIVESGSLGYGDFAPFYNGLPLGEAEAVGRKAAALLGCPEASAAACLRAAPLDRLAAVLKAIPTYSFGVVVDGTVVTKPLQEAVKSGDFKHAPILNGSNRDEWTWVEGLSEAAAGRPLAESEMTTHLEDTFGQVAAAAAQRYRAADFHGSAGAASARAVTDGLFLCPLLALDSELAKSTQVWGYEFNDVRAPVPFKPASFPYGAAHTLEMRYLFQDYTGAVGQLKPLSADQQTLSDAMVSYWTTFAETGDPNSAATPAWPRLEGSDPSYLSLAPPRPQLISSTSLDGEHRCAAFWRRPEGRTSPR